MLARLFGSISRTPDKRLCRVTCVDWAVQVLGGLHRLSEKQKAESRKVKNKELIYELACDNRSGPFDCLGQ